MIQYEPVIGLEVHVELNTKSKMFCACPADYFGKEPNTHTCPICLGLPGALPYTNQEAIEKCLKIGLALNCTVAKESLFERKNYFYPDLPKGYQISQYRWPLCVNGWIEVKASGGAKKKISINRAHQEEDTGKLIHVGGQTLVDFNRSGVPLVEIVTEPDFTDTNQIRDYAQKLQLIIRSLGVSAADMEKGDMRLEANISVRKKGQKELPSYRVELKNINSFRFMVAAVEFEIKRQIKALESGEKLHQETRGWNEEKRETYLQRSKEEANDYKYFPEPDLPKLVIGDQIVKNQRSQIVPLLPQTKLKQASLNYKLPAQITEILIRQNTFDLFEKTAEVGRKQSINPYSIATFIINHKTTSSTNPSRIIDEILTKTTNLLVDQDQLQSIAQEVIEENPKAVSDYKAGKVASIQVLIGAVMKKTQGKASPSGTVEILENLLK